MKRVAFRPAIAAAFLLAATACSEGEDSDVALPEVPTYEGAIDLEIGELDGDDSYLFSSIQDVAADELGRVIVADRQSLDIRVFGPDGDFAFQFGGPGEGPGEFEDLCCLEFAPDGELWVRESARYSAFVLHADGAEHQRVVRTPHPGHIGLRDPFSFDMAGDLVSVGPVPRDGGPSLDARFRVGADGAGTPSSWRTRSASPPARRPCRSNGDPTGASRTSITPSARNGSTPTRTAAHGPR